MSAKHFFTVFHLKNLLKMKGRIMKETFAHATLCTENSRYTRKETLKLEKNKGTNPEVKKRSFLRKNSKKCCMRCKKLTCARFTLNRKSVYLKLTCEKQIIIKPVQSEHAI